MLLLLPAGRPSSSSSSSGGLVPLVAVVDPPAPWPAQQGAGFLSREAARCLVMVEGGGRAGQGKG